DAIHPRLQVRAFFEPMEAPIRAQVGLLNEIVRIRGIAGHAECTGVERVHERHCELDELCLIGHGPRPYPSTIFHPPCTNDGHLSDRDLSGDEIVRRMLTVTGLIGAVGPARAGDRRFGPFRGADPNGPSRFPEGHCGPAFAAMRSAQRPDAVRRTPCADWTS